MRAALGDWEHGRGRCSRAPPGAHRPRADLPWALRIQLRPGPEFPPGSQAAESHPSPSTLPLLPRGLLWPLREGLSLCSALTSFKGKAVGRGFTEINAVHPSQVYNLMQ